MKDKYFLRSVLFILIFTSLITVLFFLEVESPLPIIYPYLLLSVYHKLFKKRTHILTKSLFALSIAVIFAIYGLTILNIAIDKSTFYLIFYIYYTVVLFSVSTLIMIRLNLSMNNTLSYIEERSNSITIFLSAQGIITSVILSYICLTKVDDSIEFDSKIPYTIHAIFILGGIYIVYLMHSNYEKPVLIKHSTNYQYCSLCKGEQAKINSCLEKLESAMLDKRIYLRKNLKREQLANEINLSEHCLSQLLNNVVGLSYYSYLAKYRVEHCLKYYVTTNSTLTIEAIASECGFNSVNSFNRHFTEIIGCKFSEYRSKNNLIT